MGARRPRKRRGRPRPTVGHWQHRPSARRRRGPAGSETRRRSAAAAPQARPCPPGPPRPGRDRPAAGAHWRRSAALPTTPALAPAPPAARPPSPGPHGAPQPARAALAPPSGPPPPRPPPRFAVPPPSPACPPIGDVIDDVHGMGSTQLIRRSGRHGEHHHHTTSSHRRFLRRRRPPPPPPPPPPRPWYAALPCPALRRPSDRAAGRQEADAMGDAAGFARPRTRRAATTRARPSSRPKVRQQHAHHRDEAPSRPPALEGRHDR